MISADTLVIGSGVAATALVQRLLAHDPAASILMLEAGERVKMQDAAIWQDHVVSGKLPYTPYLDAAYPDRDQAGENISAGRTQVPLQGARVFTFGGSTIHWGGWCFRLKPEDFQLRSRVGRGADWPFDYAVLEPYYCQAEQHVGVSGDSGDTTVPRSAGYPFPAFPHTLQDRPVAAAMSALGIGCSHVPIARHGITDTFSRRAPCQTTGTCKYCPFGARYSANNILDDLREWEDHPNFSIRLDSVVEEIRMASRQRAAGVIVTDRRTGERIEVEAGRIVVAAGAIESAKLLQRSRSAGWKHGIGNDHQLVGRHLALHPYFTFSAGLAGNPQRLQAEMNFPTLCSRHFDSPAEQARGKFLLINPPAMPAVDILGLMRAGARRAEIDRRVSGPVQVQLQGMVETFGEHHNLVIGVERRNHMGLPETLVDFSEDGTDRRMAEIQVHVEAIFAAMGATPAGKPSMSWRADHASCTCRMGHDEASSVTDADLRVHGTDNLHVCSNAVFPSVGAVNPTLTLTALALRLGDHLHRSAGSRDDAR